MNYKKPTFGLVIIATIIVVVVTALLLTNPLQHRTKLMGANYQIDKVIYDYGQSLLDENSLYYSITANHDLYVLKDESGHAWRSETWEYVGTMEPYPLTNKELDNYTATKVGWISKYNVRKITDAYILRLGDDNNHFYLAIQTRNGDTILGYGWEDISERNQGASDDTSIQWMVLLESTFTKGSINTDFFARSLKNVVGSDVNCFSFYENDETLGFLIVGFQSNGSSELSDMGFAVFQCNGNGYRLLNHHLYADTASSDKQIYYAEHLAIADKATYDVILSCNENLASISRIVDDQQEIVKTVDASPSMTLFNHRADETKSKNVSYHFYDKYGNEISPE